MSPLIFAKIAHFSAYFASSGPAETPLHQMTPQQKIALASKIRAGHADAILKVMSGSVSEDEVTAKQEFFAHPDVQRKLIKGWIHGTMTEPAIIDAMKNSGAVLTEDACNKIWHAKSALMLDTFKNRPEKLSVLPLLKNLSIEHKQEIAESCFKYSRSLRSFEFGRGKRKRLKFLRLERQQYYGNLLLNKDFQELVTDLIPKVSVDNALYDKLIVCKNKREGVREGPISQTVSLSKNQRRIRFEDVIPKFSETETELGIGIVKDDVTPISIPTIQAQEENTAFSRVQSLIGLTTLSMVVLQLFAYASNQNRLIGAMDGLMIPHTFPSQVGMFPLQDFQYGPGVTPFNVNNVNNTKSDFQYISFDEFEIEDDEFDASVDAEVDAPKPAIDILEYQYASYAASLNFAASNASKPVFYTSLGDLGDYGWNATATDMNDDAEYADMPDLVPLHQSEIEK